MSHPAGQPTSFKTNVNRAKTKRWVEAKSYSYDGDDWGDVDEYDEYGGYDEPPAPPKPAGLRQQGQSANRDFDQGPPSGVQQGSLDDGGQTYGNIGGPPPQQQQYGARSVTNPQRPYYSDMGRSSSFDRGDERRAFSAGGPEYGMASPNQAPYHHPPPQQEQPPATRLPSLGVDTRSYNASIPQDVHPPGQPYQTQPRQYQTGPSLSSQAQDRPSMDSQTRNTELVHPPAVNYRGVSYSDQPHRTSTGSRTQSMNSNSPSLDIHNRRDFSPSAMPPPLHTRASPPPHGSAETQLSNRFPPRKSSLNRQDSPTLPNLGQASSMLSGPLTSFDASVDPEDSLALTKERASSTFSKPLPFVRPADIYRRMQEEKEREKQSQSSSRPSMNAVIDSSNEPEINPSSSHAGKRLELDSTGREAPRSVNANRLAGDEIGRRSQEPFDPESGTSFDDFSRKNSSSAAKTNSTTPTALEETRPNVHDKIQDDYGTQQSRLPDVPHVSGFGESFLGTPNDTGADRTSSPVASGWHSHPAINPSIQPPESSDLQHQPSLGFRSVVNQAFDVPDDQAPPTPSSTVVRTNSESTSGVSPIMSRGPSTATAESKSREAESRAISTPMIPEEVSEFRSKRASSSTPRYETGSRPASSSTLGTPRQIVRKPSPSQNARPESGDSVPTSFIPGHRRNISTPSPDNSPARTPTLEAISQLRQPQAAELAINPGARGPEYAHDETRSPTSDYAARESEPDSAISQGSDMRSAVIAAATSDPRTSFLEKRKGGSVGGMSIVSVDSSGERADSPSKSRVRDLAGRFESGDSNSRNSDQSLPLRGGVSTASSQRLNELSQARPLADRMESFRPRLPGGWESFASNAPSTPPNRQNTFSSDDPAEQVVISDTAQQHEAKMDTPVTARLAERKKVDQSSISKDEESSSDPYSILAAAGTALAGALVAAAGMDHHESSTNAGLETPPSGHQSPQDSEGHGAVRGRSVSVKNTAFNPEASRPSMPYLMDDSASSAAPTPPLKDTPLQDSETPEASDYFPPIVPLKQKPRGDTITREDLIQVRPPMFPSLSTDMRPDDYESDRLRREIVKTLSPGGYNESITSSVQDDARQSANTSPRGPGHESMVIPREYDSYWNGSSSGDEQSQRSSHSHVGSETKINAQHGGAPNVVPLIAEAQQRTTSRDLHDTGETQARPGLLTQRFSWEQESAEGATPRQTPIADVPVDSSATNPKPPSHDQTVVPAEQSNILGTERNHVSPSQIGSEELDKDSQITLDTVPLGRKPDMSGSPSEREFSSTRIDLSGNEETPYRQSGASSDDINLPGYVGGLEVFEPSSEKQTYDDSSDVRTHPEASDDTLSRGSIPPEDDHRQEPKSYGSAGLARPSDAGVLPTLPPSNNQTKIPAFREILALKTSTDRIRAYNETREQFANMETGLAHWIATTTNELPEHAHLLTQTGKPAAGGMGYKPSHIRAKLSGLRPAGAQSGQLPYYQQYLNASSQQGAPDATPGSPSTLSGPSTKGYSPSISAGGKLSTQQVQIKGKDLLHSAGVFGGKANVAAKGLFSKGRSKFRGSGGPDKAPIPSPMPDAFPRGIQPQTQPEHEPHPSSRSVSEGQPDPEVPSRNQSIPSRPLSFVAFSASIATPQSLTEASNHQSNSVPTNVLEHSQRLHDDDVINGPVQGVGSTVDRQLSRSSTAEADARQDGIQTAASDHPISPIIIGDAAPIFPHQTPTAESFIGYSEDSFGQTLTQAKIENLDRDRKAGRSQGITESAVEPVNNPDDLTYDHRPGIVTARRPGTAETREDFQALEKPFDQNSLQAQRSINTSSQLPLTKGTQLTPLTSDEQLRVSTHKNAPGQPEQLKVSEEFNGTFHSSDDAMKLPFLSRSPVQSPKKSRASTQAILQERMGQNQQYEQRSPRTLAPLPLDSSIASTYQNTGIRPFSFIQDSRDQPTQPPLGHSRQGPSIDSVHDRIDRDRPPSPVSPVRQDTVDHQPPPIYYGTNYDFGPEDGNSVPSRNRSFSRPFQDPNIHQHPAFRQEGSPGEDTDMPTDYYPAQIKREEAVFPRQQATEYQLEGIGPPIAETVESKPRSRRSSRGSAFFNMLTSPSKVETPPVPVSSGFPGPASATASPITREKKSKRLSLFRSLTGHAGSDRGSGSDREQGRDSMVAQSARPRYDPSHQSPSATGVPGATDNTSRSKLTKSRNKLQRASGPGTTDQDPGKKKRFSAFGSLFGRSNSKKSTPASPTVQSAHPRLPSQQPLQQPPPLNQQPPQTYYDEPSPPLGQNIGYYSPRNDYDQHPPGSYDQPPPGGYYDPSRRAISPSQRFSSPDPSALNRRSSPDSRSYASPRYLSPTQPSALQYSPQNASTSPRTSISAHNRSPSRGRSTADVPPQTRLSWSPEQGYLDHHISHARSPSRHSHRAPSPVPPTFLPQTTYAPPQPISAPAHYPQSYASSPPNYTQPSQSRTPSPLPPPPPPKDSRYTPFPRPQTLPPLQTSLPTPNQTTPIQHRNPKSPLERKARQEEIERLGISDGSRWSGRRGSARQSGGEEEVVVMSSTSYPGQEWRPEGLGAGWEGE